ncbi:protein trunk [Uranotaenia lowii]|uniref:protein trunk n=1 Tax=Uranotaenia lowii TaxID=190385 RepID=UPI0024792DBC|nr:protein trunk [Uranotaenia lowii]
MQGILLLFCTTIGVALSPNEHPMDYLKNQRPSCAKLTDPILSDILGPAFNSRYMSIEKPPIMEDEPIGGDGSGKRGVGNGLYPSFYVEEDHTVELGDDPAWAVDHAKDTKNPVLLAKTKRQVFDGLLNDMSHESRSSRSSKGRGQGQTTGSGSSRPWHCEGKIRWIDLGYDYFPRFLRTVDCLKTRCWYGHYRCIARSFTVKMLRRRNGECVPGGELTDVGVQGIPVELRELWVWEERAVNFCCDCAME